jgi:hypothetical protein
MPRPSGTIRIVFERPDGGVSIDIPALVKVDEDENGMPIMDELAGLDLANHITWLELAHGWTHRATITAAELPNERPGQSRRFRNCWRWDGSKIEADLALARAQVMVEVRAERNTRLAGTDGEAVKGVELGQADQALVTFRQTLRDLPATVGTELAALGSAAELEAYAVDWPVPA